MENAKDVYTSNPRLLQILDVFCCFSFAFSPRSIRIWTTAHPSPVVAFGVICAGAGESGKSTVVKQLKMIHRVQMDQQELNLYRVNLHNNTLASMQVFMEAAEKFGFTWDEEEKVSTPTHIQQFAVHFLTCEHAPTRTQPAWCAH